MSPSVKVFAVSVAVCSTILLATLKVASSQMRESKLQALEKRAQAIYGILEATSAYIASQNNQSEFIKKVTTARSERSLTDEEKDEILRQSPFFAAFRIGTENAAQDLYQFRVFSSRPRNPKYLAVAEEVEVFKQFLENPNLKEYRQVTESSLTIYRPVRAQQAHGCLACHGSPTESPYGNGRDVLNYPMEDMKDGDLLGVFAIKSDF